MGGTSVNTDNYENNDQHLGYPHVNLHKYFSPCDELLSVFFKTRLLTGELVVHCLQNIVNAFDLVVVCRAVPIIKVNLPESIKR